jgi:hypothetical protein
LLQLRIAIAQDNPNNINKIGQIIPNTCEGGLNFTLPPAVLPILQKAVTV